jgi:hypothetical protein
MQRYVVILKMCLFLGDEALQSSKKHAACTNAVGTKNGDFWIDEISVNPRKISDRKKYVHSENI